MAKQAKAALETEALDAVSDRGTVNGEEILACDEAGITVTLTASTPEPEGGARCVSSARRDL